jgi:uncharacterized protein (DUF433 family)
MKSVVDKQSVPLAMDDAGVFRVGDTRVTLDTVVAAFDAGCTCEEIAQQYPSLRLSDIYVVVGYYLNHREDLKPYFERREAERAQLQSERPLAPSESNQAIRNRLLSRRPADG